MIISFSGHMGSGKDTAGSIVQELLQTSEDTAINLSTWEIKKWAGPLRKVAAILLGMDEAFLYTDEFKKMVLSDEWSSYYYKTSQMIKAIDVYLTQEEFNQLPNLAMSITRKNMTGREFLQKLGTEAMRDRLHPDVWVNALMSLYNKSNPNYLYPNWIITDTRFPNELQAVKKHEGITICIKRNLQSNFARLHPSETALDNASFDHVIDNNGTIEELREKLITILNQENLL